MKLDSTIAAVVTGGASGLGAATVRALRARDVAVAVFDRDVTSGEVLAAETGALFFAVDVTSDESVDAGFAAARAAHGQERILVTCAGIAPAARTVRLDRETGVRSPHDMALFAQVLAVNLSGTFRCMARAAAGMGGLDPLDSEGSRGAIVATASIAAQDGQVGQVAYAASKGGVAAMTLPLARDLMADGIRVNTILPGIFQTPMVAAMPQTVQDSLGAMVPFPARLGRPDEYARAALFLLESDYMNGECLRLDGAVRMAAK